MPAPLNQGLVILRLLAALPCLSVLTAGCSSPAASQQIAMDQQLASDLTVVSRTRVFFGHQSVGGNIIDGIRQLTQTAGAPLAILPLHSSDPSHGPMFLHAFIGENGRPSSKIDAFAAGLDRLAPDPVDVAVMKFCYVDFAADTDIQELFDAYAQRVAALQKRYPHTTFVHVTTPLKAPEGIKGWVKQLIGRGRPVDENIRRNQYNALLRRRFASHVIFDLAAVESTEPDGARSTFQARGRTYEQLASAYTSDGAHLNNNGSQVAARALIAAVASAVRSTRGVQARHRGETGSSADAPLVAVAAEAVQ